MRAACVLSRLSRGRPLMHTARRGFSDLVGWKVQNIPGSDRSVGTITLQSEATLNALTVEMGQDFQELVRKLEYDISTGNQKVDCIVIVGQGDTAFSAGGDLDWLRSLKEHSVHENADLMLRFYKSFLCIRNVPVPTIAALHGPAMGAGAGLALACDLRTAARNKSKILGLHFTRLGIHTGMGGSHLLSVQNVPNAILNEILFCGKILSGQECLDYGLVNVLSDDAKQAAYELAEKVVTDTHPVAVRTLVQTMRVKQDVGLDLALQREAFAQAVCYNRRDWGEGVTAIAEKRHPSFDPYHSK